jgi:hypothetical protein
MRELLVPFVHERYALVEGLLISLLWKTWRHPKSNLYPLITEKGVVGLVQQLLFGSTVAVV